MLGNYEIYRTRCPGIMMARKEHRLLNSFLSRWSQLKGWQKCAVIEWAMCSLSSQETNDFYVCIMGDLLICTSLVSCGRSSIGKGQLHYIQSIPFSVDWREKKPNRFSKRKKEMMQKARSNLINKIAMRSEFHKWQVRTCFPLPLL